MSRYFLLFSCIAAEEAQKLGSSAKAGGGEDAEVAYMLFSNDFCYVFVSNSLLILFWQ